MSLTSQAAQGVHAWSTIDALFLPWQSPASALAATVASALGSLPSESQLRSSFGVLRSLGLAQRFRDHLSHDLLRPWADTTLLARWWSGMDAFATVQTSEFGSASAPKRFSARLTSWLLRVVPTVVSGAHDTLHPLFERLAMFDRISQAEPNETMVARFHRMIATLFARSLQQQTGSTRQDLCESHDDDTVADAVAAATDASSFSGVRRADLFRELLFKYYRVNFRAFHRVALAGDSTDDDSSAHAAAVDETMEAVEAEAADAAEVAEEQMDDGENQGDAAVSPDATLQQFSTTCSLLLSMHFIGSSAGDAAVAPAPSPLASPSSSLFAASSPSLTPSSSSPLVSSWIAPSHFLDFFFILIEKYLRHSCLGEWDAEKLTQVNAWLEQRVKPFLHIILTGETSDPSHTAAVAVAASSPRHASFLHWYSRLHFYAMECFGLMRIREEMFGLVKDYPDSLPALRDLSSVLSITKQHRLLIESLARVFRTRLLQPGTDTKSILEQYANAIACCRILDPNSTHSLLAGVIDCSAIGPYVKQRPDAVRNVVRAVWGSMAQRAADEEEDEEDEEKEDALDETARSDAAEEADLPAPSLDEVDAGGLDLVSELEATPDATQFGDDSDAEDIPAVAHTAVPGDPHGDGAWHPDPLSGSDFALTAAASSTRYLRQADVLSLLIDLCGNGERNEELLLVEYKNFLADRLLAKRSRAGRSKRSGRAGDVRTRVPKDPLYETELEVTHLELMKLRFGDTNTSLVDVEVMLRDIVNSKRIRTQIAARSPAGDDAAHTHLHQAIIARHERLHASDDDDERAAAGSDSDLRTSLGLAASFNALLLSAEFWPDPEADLTFKLPPSMRAVLDAYADMFHTLKTPRELEWVVGATAEQGNACHIELEMKDGRIEQIECEPIHVAILDKFAEHDDDDEAADAMVDGVASSTRERTEWSLEDLAEALEIDDEDDLKPKMQFWLQRGILRVMPSDDPDASPVYQLVEFHSGAEDDDDGVGGDAATMPGQMSEKQQREQDAQVEMYVLGSLGNFARLAAHREHMRPALPPLRSALLTWRLSLPPVLRFPFLLRRYSLSVDRLHNMMKTISTNVSGFLYTKSEADLRLVLHSMVQRGLLALKDGHFSKPTTLQA